MQHGIFLQLTYDLGRIQYTIPPVLRDRQEFRMTRGASYSIRHTQPRPGRQREEEKVEEITKDLTPISLLKKKVKTAEPGRRAYRRWICLAKLLLEAEQGNWTSLCRVALRNRSQKFSKSSKSSSDVFSNTAITSVVTILYTTKNDACKEESAEEQPSVKKCLGNIILLKTCTAQINERRLQLQHAGSMAPRGSGPRLRHRLQCSASALERLSVDRSLTVSVPLDFLNWTAHKIKRLSIL